MSARDMTVFRGNDPNPYQKTTDSSTPLLPFQGGRSTQACMRSVDNIFVSEPCSGPPRDATSCSAHTEETSRISQIKDNRSLSDFHTIFNGAPFFINQPAAGPHPLPVARSTPAAKGRNNDRKTAKKISRSVSRSRSGNNCRIPPNPKRQHKKSRRALPK